MRHLAECGSAMEEEVQCSQGSVLSTRSSKRRTTNFHFDQRDNPCEFEVGQKRRFIAPIIVLEAMQSPIPHIIDAFRSRVVIGGCCRSTCSCCISGVHECRE